MSADITKERCVAEIANEIREYIVENILFGDEEALGDETSFQESGILDSTGMLEIITLVEERFGIEIADSEVVPENLGSLAQISRFVQRKVGSDNTPHAVS